MFNIWTLTFAFLFLCSFLLVHCAMAIHLAVSISELWLVNLLVLSTPVTSSSWQWMLVLFCQARRLESASIVSPLGISVRIENVERINRWTRHSRLTNAVTAWLKATVAKSSFVPVPVIELMMTWRPQLRHLAVTGPTNSQNNLSKSYFYIRSVAGPEDQF
jgi:hypothetical protein